MNLDLTTEDSEFRSEVRAFLRDNLTEELSNAGRLVTSVFIEPQFSLPWQKILHAQGWAAPAWPVEYGGTGWTEMQRYIFASECARAGAPSLSPMGLAMVGPCIIGHGTPEQKAHYLPRILAGQDYWCQGYSEPGSGSDLASLSLKAESDGDDYVLNGTKIWTTHAHHANMMFCLVRTRFDGKPQEGITFLLLDMTLPGIKVDPIITLAGEHEVNQVFFDDVRVPKANVIGKVNEGWTVAKYLLEFERGGSSYGPRLKARVGSLCKHAAEAGMGADMAAKLSQAEADASALEAAELMMMSELSTGGTPGLKASMMKIKGTELSQRLTELALEIAGNWAQPFQPHHTNPGGEVVNAPSNSAALVGPESAVTVSAKYLNDRAGSIYAGSNEIQRNILAKAQLGL